MTRKVREIQDLVIDEISLVDKGANQHATVTIAKSADGEKENYMDVYDEQGNQLDPDALDIGDVVFDADGDAYEIQADTDDEFEDEFEFDEEQELAEVGKSFQGQAIRAGMVARGSKPYQAAGRGASKVRNARASRSASRARTAIDRNGMGPRTLRQSTAADALAAFSRPTAGAQMAAIRGGERAGRAAGAAAGGATSWAKGHKRQLGYAGGALGVAGIGGASGYAGGRVRKALSASDLREELSKALTDRDRDEVIAKAFGQIEELSKAAEAAQAAAEQEREIRLLGEYTEIAKSYELPTVEVDDLAQALMNMAEHLSYKDCEVIGKALQFAAETQDALYNEVGSIGGGDNSDVLQMVNAHVDGYISKNQGVGREELIAEVFANNPEAYDQYLAERG